MHERSFKKFCTLNKLGSIVMLLLGFFFIYLLLTSGAQVHRALWLFVYPPAAFYLLGRREALLYTSLLFMAVLILFSLHKHFSLGFSVWCRIQVYFPLFLFLLSERSLSLLGPLNAGIKRARRMDNSSLRERQGSWLKQKDRLNQPSMLKASFWPT